MRKNNTIQEILAKDHFIEIFRLEDIDETVFNNYQRYDFYQLIWFTKISGNDRYFLDFNEHLIYNNQIVLVFPGQIDKLDIEGNEGFLFAIHPDNFFRINQRMNSAYLNGYFSNIFISPDAETTELLEVFKDLLLQESNSLNRILLKEIYIEAFLFHIVDFFKKTDAYKNQVDFQIPQLMKLIDANFIHHRETDFYAQQMNISCKKLNIISVKGTGKTVKQHLQERLVLETKKEIRLKEKNLKEISFALGFEDPAYFTRFFKKQTGITPVEFRENEENKFK
ncbi:helix-turn-helix domain-containing protein [Bacteroidales bacterium OttesenSCG-928-B11]|nr:helix-turn-helix domain-containing protein [Bacteroidales bacterium OttesenSCG-928-E04]MDL2308143.1 helix-turn-helix domain-containing protein [Bacteroidales bacterium OttesenSCG-928-C03]MDL2311502.1 helix-turn-helix domain-containing protein [Bacteroidales bacterium OttesenSCG-928-B11]MDL2325569.1 helix-turn-helix domain-containing protein [Bacteroidales bacterium OttesenSCG-928-A14]